MNVIEQVEIEMERLRMVAERADARIAELEAELVEQSSLSGFRPREPMTPEREAVMNVYELEMTAGCPVDPSTFDWYKVTIECFRMLQVEHINAAADHLSSSPIFQEALTAELQARTGGRVTIVGVHSGVTVTSSMGNP